MRSLKKMLIMFDIKPEGVRKCFTHSRHRESEKGPTRRTINEVMDSQKDNVNLSGVKQHRRSELEERLINSKQR